MIGNKQVLAAFQSALPAIADGTTWGEYARDHNVDPDGLREMTSVAATEPFARLHDMTGIEDGALRRFGFSAAQRKAIADEIESSMEIAFLAGVVAEATRRVQ